MTLGTRSLLLFAIVFAATAATAIACLPPPPSTTLTTSLTGGGKEGEEITVTEGTGVKDTATLKGENASKATGTVKYAVYSDSKCEKLVSKAGEVTVKEGKVPASEEKKLEAGAVYYWQAEYGGDSLDAASKSTCGKEVLTVKATTTLKTTLTGGGKEGEEIAVAEGSGVKDTATLSGTNSSKATGTVKYAVYSDSKCEKLVSKAGEGSVSGGKAAGGEEKKLEAGAVYYWQATYEGDSLHEKSTSTCGKEVLTVRATTTLTTSLTGGGKEGEEITVAEGAGVKDKATLSGTSAATATGIARYAVYSDSKCEKLVGKAGEGSVAAGVVPVSEEKKLEAGAVYYWQATYEGDALHEAAESTCGKEVLTVKATTTLKTTLTGGGKEGEEIAVAEGSGVKDTATLSGTNSSKATGTVKYAVYSDSKCEKLVSKAGEGSVSGGKAAGGEEKKLEAGAVYYWQATYEGDALHEAAESTCGKEVLTVKATMSLTTALGGGGKEGKEISIADGYPVIDTATLSGTKSSTATGTVKYAVYGDSKCEELVTEAGEATVEEGEVPDSGEVELEAGAYHWQVSYGGDGLHEASTSSCDEVATIVASTSLTTSLSGEGREGEENEEEEIESEITVVEGSAVIDTASLSGANVSEATGTVKYLVYSDIECEELAAEAGDVTVEGASVPPSSEVMLEPGTYFWQAVYSGDGANYASMTPCGSEIQFVTPPLTMTLSGGEESGDEIEVLEETLVSDDATLHGAHAGEATGTVEYSVYSDDKCEELLSKAGEVTLKEGEVPASEGKKLKAGTYYWQAKYSGDAEDPPATSACGAAIAVVVTPTTLTTSLSGGGKEGSEIEVEEGAAVVDQATLSGANASSAEGEVMYSVYSDSECTELAALAGAVEVSKGKVPPSEEVTLEAGTYYWQAQYTGDGLNRAVSGTCGAEIATVTWPVTLSLTGGEASGPEIEILTGTAVVANATLHGAHAAEATGTVEYFVYSDEKCEELVAKAGKATVAGASVPSSSKEELESGTYYWQAKYSGDAKNPPADSRCGPAEVFDINAASDKYAALGDSYSAGEGVEHPDGFGNPVGQYYARTTAPRLQASGPFMNRCHRSSSAWPALLASAIYGGTVTAENEVLKQQPPKFIFRACSGAVTTNVRSAAVNPNPSSGQWDEPLPAPLWVHVKPAQDLWLGLPGGVVPPGPAGVAPNNAIKLVTITIGGNDAGFAEVAKKCVQRPLQVNFSPTNCLTTIANEEAAGFAAIAARLPVVLSGIRELAPTARIRVPMYPRVVNWLRPGNIPAGFLGGKLLRLNNVAEGPPPQRLTAAKAIDGFIWRLNTKIVDVVKAWEEANGGDAKVVPDTENSFVGHMLGDPKPWLNRVVLRHVVESFHPNACGYRALALTVLTLVRRGIGMPPTLCT